MIIRIIAISISFLYSLNNFATNLPIKPVKFQIKQEIINTYTNSDDDTPILSQEEQNLHLQRLINHVYSTDDYSKSPWSEAHVSSLLPKIMKKSKKSIPISFDNKHYAFNFHNHTPQWVAAINYQLQNAHFFENYKKSHRAIVIHNTMARKLPTLDPDYFHYKHAGQGYPFDNIQESSVYIGTPVYVLATSENLAWSYVITPDEYNAWVPSKDIGYVSKDFINQWNNLVEKNLIAITKNDVSLRDQQNGFEQTGYIGTMLPGKQVNNRNFLVYIPYVNEDNHAQIKLAIIPEDSATKMPLQYSLKNISKILEQNINRPYGWGGLYFYNDCSQELKSFFTPFGLWLPRNSAAQISQATRLYDFSSMTPQDRLVKLKAEGHPWLSLIDIEGHVMLYIGQYPKQSPKSIAMTYQNIWAYHDTNEDMRYIIGKATILPLLEKIPLDGNIKSQVSREKFRWINLDELTSSENN